MPRVVPVTKSIRSIVVQNRNASAVVPLGLQPPERPRHSTPFAVVKLTKRLHGLGAAIHKNDGKLHQFVRSSAFQLLAIVVVNATISVAFSWLSALSFITGNVFSASSPSDQSHRSFLVGVLIWIHVWFCGVVWIGCSLRLFQTELLSHPGRPAGVVRVLSRMFQRTILWFLFSGAAVAGIGYGFGSLGASYRKYRLEFYTSAIWNYSCVYVADQAARKIYRYETLQGNGRHQLQRQQTPPHLHQQRKRSPRQLVLSFLEHGTLLVSLFVPTLYVHAISFAGRIESTHFVWLFTVASLVLKVLMQEAAKTYILRSKIHSARTMVTVVAVPTVLIDTQVRIVLLRFQDTQIAMSTTVAIAVAEVCVRVGKTLLLKWNIQRRQKQITTKLTSTARPATTTTSDNLTNSRYNLEFECWRGQLQRYHAIEVTADMYAEYLAIGCSSAIMVMFGQHPQFLLTTPTTLAANTASAWMSSSTHLQLVAQVAMEVVVDLVSCAVEVSSGITFTHVNQERGYFLVLCVALALVNVNVSSILYLAY